MIVIARSFALENVKKRYTFANVVLEFRNSARAAIRDADIHATVRRIAFATRDL